jgi:hypothetical protein
MASITSSAAAHKVNRSVGIGSPGKTFTARECSCYEAAPGRFVIQLTVFHARAAAEVDFYDCTPLPAPAWGQAAFRLVKAAPVADRPAYNVLLDGDRSTCDCPHGTYKANSGPCRHVLAVQALTARGKLPAPKAVAKPVEAPKPAPAVQLLPVVAGGFTPGCGDDL